MSKTSYYKALQGALPKPRFCDTWGRQLVEAGIAEITEAMKGPMSNADRVSAHLDRKALRERLAELIGSPESAR